MRTCIVKLTYIVLTAIVCSGCSTIQTHTGEEKIIRPYMGTSKAINKAKKVWNDYDYFGQFELYTMDIPASLIADTIIFPFDLYNYLIEEKNQNE